MIKRFTKSTMNTRWKRKIRALWKVPVNSLNCYCLVNINQRNQAKCQCSRLQLTCRRVLNPKGMPCLIKNVFTRVFQIIWHLQNLDRFMSIKLYFLHKPLNFWQSKNRTLRTIHQDYVTFTGFNVNMKFFLI